jgi:hypothetical protein
VIDFYRLVADQVNANGLPNLQAYKVVLEANEYPLEAHGWLMRAAGTLHRLVQKIEIVDWISEVGKPYRHVTAEDLHSGD